nr:hypothetical protein [Salinibacterium sp. ZJ70]
MAAHLADEARLQGQHLHRGGNRVLDTPNRKMLKIAGSVLPPPADVVAVHLIGTVLCLDVDHPVMAAGLMTPVAAHQASKEVAVHAVARNRSAAFCVDLLHAFEGLRGDQRFVAPVENLALVRHHAEVVRIPEYQAQLVEGYLSRLPLCGSTGREALVRESVAQLSNAVLPRRVRFERPTWPSFTTALAEEGVELRAKNLYAYRSAVLEADIADLPNTLRVAVEAISEFTHR